MSLELLEPKSPYEFDLKSNFALKSIQSTNEFNDVKWELPSMSPKGMPNKYYISYPPTTHTKHTIMGGSYHPITNLAHP